MELHDRITKALAQLPAHEQLLISAATETPDEDLPGDEDAQAPADPDPPRTFRYRSHETPLNEDDPTHLLAGAVGREALAA